MRPEWPLPPSGRLIELDSLVTDSQTEPAVVTVKRWTRHGHDRVYATLGDIELGYRDLHSGTVHCHVPDEAETLEKATDHLWRQARAAQYEPRHAAGGEGTAPTTVAPSTLPEPLPDRDLSVNRPGQAVHAKAQELRAAAPVRTRVARVLGVKTDERNWRIGGEAEEAVAKRLGRLGSAWHVLHAIPVGERGSDIDHVVIGPGGVFTINAKHHPDAKVWVRGDTVKINGSNVPYVRNSRHEASRAATLLSARALFDVEVHGVIAIMGAEKDFTVVEQPSDGVVTVVRRKKIDDHLASLPAVLGEPSITRIYEVARHLATWQPATVEWSDDLRAVLRGSTRAGPGTAR